MFMLKTSVQKVGQGWGFGLERVLSSLDPASLAGLAARVKRGGVAAHRMGTGPLLRFGFG